MLLPNKHRQFLGLLGISILCCVNGFTQELEISSSPTPIGSGARAAGMANAFVAIADDATAASWNPAGLVQLERPEISFVGEYTHLWEWFESDIHQEFESRHDTNSLNLNYLSFAYPFSLPWLGRNMCLSLNFQRKYDFNRTFDFELSRANVLTSGRVVNYLSQGRFKQKGGLHAITPAIALEITHRLSIGAALNIWESSFLGENSWEQTTNIQTSTFVAPLTIFSETRTRERYDDLSGTNLTLGILWSPLDRLSLGFRYDTAFTGKTSFRRTMMISSLFSSGGADITVDSQRERRKVHFPSTVALGVAWRANDRFTISTDVTRTDWNDFYVTTASGKRLSLVDYHDLTNPLTRTHFQPTYTVRLGCEYVFVPKEPEEKLDHLWSLRWGVFFDQEPATGKGSGFHWISNRGSGKPDNFYGCSLGLGLLLNNRINLDFAYQLRYGPNTNKDFIRGVRGFKEDVIQHRFLLSSVIYF